MVMILKKTIRKERSTGWLIDNLLNYDEEASFDTDNSLGSLEEMAEL